MVMVLPDDGTGYLLTAFGLVVPPGPVMLYHQTNSAGYIGGMLYADITLKSAAFW